MGMTSKTMFAMSTSYPRITSISSVCCSKTSSVIMHAGCDCDLRTPEARIENKDAVEDRFEAWSLLDRRGLVGQEVQR